MPSPKPLSPAGKTVVQMLLRHESARLSGLKACTLLRSRPLRLIAALFLLSSATAGSAKETKAEHHVFLVDVSRSMKERPKGTKTSHLGLRQQRLRTLLQSFKDFDVTLMSFNNDIRSKCCYDLANSDERKMAEEWVDGLVIRKERGTHLWTCLTKALDISFAVAQRDSDRPVTLHVLTDRRDTERDSTLEEETKPEKTKDRRIKAESEAFGDFYIPIAINTSPSPTVTPPPGATVTPTPSPSATASASAAPSATATITPSPTATAGPSPTPILTPSPSGTVTPTPSASATPCIPPSPCAASVAFDIDSPRIVKSGQIVQFVNKTLPPADSYSWTVTHNVGGLKGVTPGKNRPDDDSREKQWAYQFTNTSSRAESYTVRLVATYGQTTIEAPPVIVVVQRSPTVIDLIWSNLSNIFVALGPGLGTFVLGLLKTIGELRKNKERQNEGLPRLKGGIWIGFGLSVLGLIVCISFVLPIWKSVYDHL